MKPANSILTTLLILATLALTATPVFANTAANTRITNSADLSYNDGAGTKHATSQVTVTVALKPAIPTITPLVAQSGPYPTPLVDDYILTNNANGPDTFVLASGTNSLGNTTSVTATPGSPAPATPITLGATVTGSGSYTTAGITYMIVPSDGAADNSVNGIKAGDKVFINNTDERTVIAITDNAAGTSIIEVAALGADPGAGIVIGQRVTIHATVTPNNITSGGNNVTVNVTMTAISQNDAAATATSGNVGNTFYSGSATLTKYVRNATTPNGSGGSTTTLNGITYYNNPTTLVAKPGEILEYLIYASNSSASATINSVVLIDLVPVDYVTLTTNVYGGKAFRYIPDPALPGAFTDFTTISGDDAVDYNATFDTTANAAKGKITAWIGGATPAFNTPGSIAPSKSHILLYQVTVKP